VYIIYEYNIIIYNIILLTGSTPPTPSVIIKRVKSFSKPHVFTGRCWFVSLFLCQAPAYTATPGIWAIASHGVPVVLLQRDGQAELLSVVS